MTIKKPYRFIVVCLLIGWIFDFLFSNRVIGTSFFLFVTVTIVAGLFLAKEENITPQKKSLWLIPAILYFSAMTFVRLEPFTVAMNFLATMVLLGIFAHTFQNGNWFLFNFIDYIKGAFTLFFDSLFRQIVVFSQQQKDDEGKKIRKFNWKSSLSVLRGIFITFPILIIFTSLLMEADPIFEQKVITLLSWINFENIIEYIMRIFGISIVGYFLSGIYLHAFSPKESDNFKVPSAVRFLGFTETSILLGSIIFLFSSFVAVQFQYFFGGDQSRIVEGFTYSEYARKGFAELNVVALFSLLLFVGLSLITKRDQPKHTKTFSIMGIIMMVLVGIILLSSFYRLQLYELAYGFTRLRTYTHVYIVWIALLIVATLTLEITKKQKYLTLAMLLVGLGFVTTLNFLNVDSFIVKQNLYWAGITNPSDLIQEDNNRLDVSYLSSLSADALPALYEVFLENNNPKVIGAIACLANRHNNFDYTKINYQEYNWQSFHLSRNIATNIWQEISNSNQSSFFKIEYDDNDSPFAKIDGEKIYCWQNYFID